MARVSSLVSDVLNLASSGSGGDEETMSKSAINRAYRTLLNSVNADHERREFSLTTVAEISKYGMPLYVRQVLNIEDANNNRIVFEISPREFDVSYPGTSDTGDPTRAYPLGAYGVQKQRSSSGTIQASSDSAADTGGHTLRVEGYVSGNLVTETLTVNGTSTVTSSNSYDADGIERITKHVASGYSWAGNVTITDGSNTLSKIPVWWESPTYQWFEFYPTPDTARTYTVRAISRKHDLVNDEDWPEVDEDFHNLLVWGAAADILPHVGKSSLADRMRRDYDDGLKRFRGIHQVRPNRIRTFADVKNGPLRRGRPQIPNVDYV